MNQVQACMEELDQDVIKDYLDEFQEKQEDIEKDLMALERDPANQELINNLFRAVHTIKGNSSICNLAPVIEFSHALEDLLQALRNGSVHFTNQLGEVVMLSMDRLRSIADNFFEGNIQDEVQNRKIQENLRAITTVSSGEVYSAIQYVLSLLSDNFDALDVEFDIPSFNDSSVDQELTCSMERDLDFFNSMMRQMEQRSIFWQGRGDFVLSLALEMNTRAGTPIDAYKLTAAVYLHDVAMGWLPEYVVNKMDRLDDGELRLVKQHPKLSSQLAERFNGWGGVSEMILQHHERMDGTGYPYKIPGEQICEGAKLLAVVDAFVAMIRPRADRLHRRSLLHAVTEINNNKGTQFSADWVAVFNGIVKKRYLNK